MNLSMLTVGFVIFALYMIGLFYMINYGHKSQEKEESNDPEIIKSKKL